MTFRSRPAPSSASCRSPAPTAWTCARASEPVGGACDLPLRAPPSSRRIPMAKAVRFHECGGPEVLRLEEVQVGEPGPGEVRIRHAAVGLNFADTYFRTGYYPVQPPCGIGVEAAGW